MDIFDLVDPEFIGSMSSDEIWYAGEGNICLTDVIDHKSDYDHTHTGYAATEHTHTGYASQTDLETLEDVVDTKANATHTHTGYASSTHSHDNYATVTALDTLESELDGKANSNHNHNSSYDTLGAADTALVSAKVYADNVANTVKNDLLGGAGSAYDTLKELSDLIDDNVDAIEALETVAAGKANASHTHTIANITNLQSTLDGKAAVNHSHSAVTTSASGFMIASDKSKLDGMVLATVSEVQTYLGI